LTCQEKLFSKKFKKTYSYRKHREQLVVKLL